MKTNPTFCDGLSRRSFLRVGAASALGASFSLDSLLRAESGSAGADSSKSGVSLIYVFLRGGLSTVDTFDMKPDAPEGIRGIFQPRSTNVPGIQICEHLPRVAGVMDKVSLIRSFGHSNAGHGPGDHYMLTGYHPNAAFNGGLTPNNQHPAIGSVIAQKLGARGSIPPYVCLPTMHPSGGSAYLGPTVMPFTIQADPNSPGFEVPDLMPPLNVDARRLEDRRGLLAHVDRFQRGIEKDANAGTRDLSVFSERATALMTSGDAKKAFNIHDEPLKLREAYGRNTLGQSCLMARRMVEAGVRCVTIEHQNWDTHYGQFGTLKDDLLPKLDLAMSALFTDLADRGMLKKTLVLITGEFGRTPKINKDAGRDHWSRCFTVILGGGGIEGGRVVGKSDAYASDPADNPYGPEDLCATTYSLLGLNPYDEMHTPEGRPVMLTNNGRIIKELV